MKTKTCKDCKFISKEKRVDVNTNKYIEEGFCCNKRFFTLKVFDPCEDFEQRKIVVKEVFNRGNLLVWLIFGLIVGLLEGLIFGLLEGLIFGLIVGLIFGLFTGLFTGLFFCFMGKKKIYKDSNIDEEKE